MLNPVPAHIRGILYVIAIVIGPLGAGITAALTNAGAEDWVPVVAAIVAGVTTVAAALARDNLTIDDNEHFE